MAHRTRHTAPLPGKALLAILPVLLAILIAPASAGAASSNQLIQVPQQVATLPLAISRVADGGTIELASGTYDAPAGGFRIGNANKGFTVRAALGATVVLGGQGAHPILVFHNTSLAHGGLVIFQGLTFRNGAGGSSTTSPGVTIDTAAARFVGCNFDGNGGGTGAAGGGAVLVRGGSTATFIGCNFTDNSCAIQGGAMMVQASSVQVLGGSFVANHVNLADGIPSSHGGAVSVLDGTFLVSDALFQGNQAGWVGGAIYAFGDFTATPATPSSYLSVTRSTFQSNAIAPQPCCAPPGPATGGAIHVEDQTTLDVQGSWFTGNQAQDGGALSSYRAQIDVTGSVFQGNGGSLTEGDLAVGGAICALSNDAVDASTANGQNPPPAAVSVAGSLLQGGTGGAVGNAGGCLFAAGDAPHLYGQDGLTPDGTVASNSAPVAISGSVFADCAVLLDAATAGGGQGGAVNASLVALTMANSMVLGSTAAGDGAGGGVFLSGESNAQISQTIFAGDSADTAGGALYATGSNLNVSGSDFIANQVGGSSRGSALYTQPLGATQPHVGNGDASGLVSQSIFSQNGGLAVWDADAGGATFINTMQYGSDSFFAGSFGGNVYDDTYADPSHAGFSVAGLDSLVVRRPSGVATVKAAAANLALGAAPAVGSLVAFAPAGSPTARSAPLLAYAWSGSTATLGGAPLAAHQGLIDNPAPGAYSLIANGALLGAASVAAAQCTTDPVLCLAGDRFRVQVAWQLPTGQRGDGHPAALSDDTGTFWFFDASQVDLVVKILDGRAVNGCFWVFYGALSNVQYTITVTDTVTGAVQAYVNPAGTMASVADTTAFLGTGNAPAAPPVVAPTPPATGSCARRAGDLCLADRFRLHVAWKTSTASGTATGTALAADSGTFWFFSSGDVELAVKIVDGRAVNGHFWVFYGALSNVQYTLTVTDTQTGRSKTYVNPQGAMASVGDTSALPGS